MDYITDHRSRVAHRHARSSTKGERRQSRHQNTYPLHGPVPRKAWAQRSRSAKCLGVGSRRHRHDSAVAEDPLDCGEWGSARAGYFFAANGNRVLKKKTLPRYTKQLARQEIQLDEDEREAQLLYEESQRESVPSPEVICECPRTHTQDEWEFTYRGMVHAGYQDHLSQLQDELTASNRLYEGMANHARRTVIALDEANEELVTLRQELWRAIGRRNTYERARHRHDVAARESLRRAAVNKLD